MGDANIVELTLEEVVRMRESIRAFEEIPNIVAPIGHRFSKATKPIMDELVLIDETKNKIIKSNTNEGKLDEEKTQVEWLEFLRNEDSKLKFNFDKINITDVVDREGKAVEMRPIILRHLSKLFTS